MTASPIITRIEDAMIARIKLVNTVPNFGALLKTVDRFSGEIQDENMSLLVTMAPFVLFAHAGSRVTMASSTGAQWEGEFVALCGATSRRAPTPGQTLASRIGAAPGDLGSRPIAELVRDVLDEQTFGLPMSSLDPLSLDELYSGHAGGAGGEHFFSMTGVRFTTKYSTSRSTVADGTNARLAEIVAVYAPWINGVQVNDPANNTVTLTFPEPGDPA